MKPYLPGIFRDPLPDEDSLDDFFPTDIDDLCGEQSHCSPCGVSHDGSPTMCPSCGDDTLITTWGAAQAERFWSGERYSSSPLGVADVAGAYPLKWREVTP